MTSRILGCLCLAAILITGASATEQDLWTSYRDTLKGGWVTDGVIPEGMEGTVVKGGDKFRMTSTFWIDLDGKALIGRQTFRIKGRTDYSAQSHYVAGWNPHKKVVDIRVYWSDGDIDEATVTGKEGSAFICDYTFTGGTGTTVSRDATFKIMDQNTLVWGDEENKSTWKRVKGTTATSGIDYVDYYSYFVGQWRVTEEDTEGVEGLFSVEVGPSGKCHVTRFEFGERIGDGVYGRDPITGRWTGTGLENDGTYWQQVFAPPKSKKLRPGVTFNARQIRKNSDGSKTQDSNTLTIVDQNTFTSQSANGSFKLVRTDATALSPYYENFETLEKWIGNWTSTITLNGVDFVGHFTCQWVPGKYCVAWTWKAPEIEGSPIPMHGYGIFGWDPARKQIVELGFGSNGLVYTTYFDVRNDSLHGTRHTVLPDGKKVTESMIFTAEKDRILIKNLERTDANGEVIPFLFPEDGSFERVK